MGHQLVRFLASGIQRDWVIDVVTLGEREFGIGPIHRTGRREYQMSNLLMPTPLQNVGESHQIGVNVLLRRLNRVSDAGLRRKIYHDIEITF